MSKYVRTGVWGRAPGTLCAHCKKNKPRTKDHWGPDKASSDGLSRGWCRRCITAYSKARGKEARLNAIIHYSCGSPHCACCGDDRFEFLCLDHIDGGGNAHRLAVTGSKRGSIALWLEKNGYPDGFQVLCHNCNMAKHIHGTCPYATSHVWPRTSRLRKVS